MLHVQLGYEDVLELLGYRETKRRVLEILGYPYSPDGQDAWRAKRPDVAALLVPAIVHDLGTVGTFPASLGAMEKARIRDGGIGEFVEKVGNEYCVVAFEKYDGVHAWYSDPEDAARALIRARVDAAWIPGLELAPPSRREHVNTWRSWTHP